MAKHTAKVMTLAQFVAKAIPHPAEANKANGYDSKGVHSRYSGLNDVVRAYIGKTSNIFAHEVEWSTVYEQLKELEDKQVIAKRPVKGGYMVYLYKDFEEAKAKSSAKKGEDILNLLMK